MNDEPDDVGGLPFDSIMRTLCDRQSDDEPPPDPWHDPTAFVDWLRGSDFPGPNNNISRYLRAVYMSRPDLSRAFPEVPGRDLPAFYRWTHEHGVTELSIPHALLPAKDWRFTPRRVHRPRRDGVNLVGFLDDARGIGEVARRIGAALERANVPVYRASYPEHFAVPVEASRPTKMANEINVVCINPDSLARFARNSGGLLDHSYTIGVWFWETEELPPSFGWAFDYVDEIWAASDFVKSAVSRLAPDRVEVTRFDVPIVVPSTDPYFDAAAMGLPTGRFMFLTSFDYLSVVDRKNPIGAIDAFSQAFRPGEGPILVVKSSNAHARPEQQRRVQAAVHDRDDIVFVEANLEPETNAALMAQCDCFVSLHRSEGFGLNIADALALGRPVIATDYGANVEYMSDLRNWLVRGTVEEIGEGQHPYPSHHRWAAPDTSDAAEKMRRVVADPTSAREVASRHGQQLTEQFSLDAVGRSLRTRLAQLTRRRWHR